VPAGPARGRWPVDERTRARIARRHFLDQATKVEIGAEFGLSRFQVAKVVQECLEDGTVTITIHGPEHVDDVLSDRLARRYGLVDALVVDDVAGAGHYAVTLLAARLADGDVLAVGWNGAIEDVLTAAGGLPRCEVVQVRGVAGLADGSVELVKRVAALCGGEAYPIYAPFIAGSAEDAAVLRAHPLVAVATARFDRVRCAVVGVEHLAPADGADGGDRTIGLSAAQLGRVPFVLLADLAPDAAALSALRAALEGGAVHGVVTDMASATALLG
jgi:DNA-binding transcriptional regulator LsrR (DeoR family)